MATADPGSGPSLFGVSNKLQNKVNSFREVIERKKSEVRIVCKEMINHIERKEISIIRELDNILCEVNVGIEKKIIETQKHIRELEFKKKEIDEILRKLNPIETHFSQLSEAIESAKGEMDIDIPNVKLTWKVNELKDCINRMCVVVINRF